MKVKKALILIPVISFLFLSAGLAFFLTLYFQTSSFTILNHSYRLSLFSFILSLMGVFILLIFSWISLANLDVKLFSAGRVSSLWKNFFPYLPLCFFLLTPLLLKHYFTSDDLKTRLKLLAVFIVLCSIYLKLAQWNRWLKGKNLLQKWTDKFIRLSLKKKLLILFLLAFAIYNLCTFNLVSKGMAFSGDEPYYLLTAHSLYQDKDINVANNYDNKDYFHFYPKELYPNLRLRAYGRFGRKGYDYVYPINQPGLSVLILPYYWFSQLFKGKILIFILKGSLSIWAVLLGLQIYLLAGELWRNEKISLLIWFLYSFSAPILFYAIHLYPEIPIALFSVYIFRKIRSDKPLSVFQLFFLGLLLSLYFWFGLKYNMIFWPFLVVSIYFLLKNHKVRWRVLYFLAFPILSLVLFYYYLYELYGSFYPIAIYEGVLTPEKMRAFREMMIKIPILLRIDSFLDYFLDQRDGLLLYSPLYFFSFLGFVEVFRRAKKDFIILLFISLPFVLNYAFFSHRQGYSPQGRVLTAISWIGAILIGYFIAYNRKKLYSSLFWFCCLAGFVIVVILLQYPSFLYQPTTHEFTFRAGELFTFLSNLHFSLPSLLPSFIKVNNVGYLPNYIWLGLILLFIAGYLLKKDIALPSKYSFRMLLVSTGLLLFFAWFVLYPRPSLLFPTNTAYPTGEKITFYSLGRHAQMSEPGQFNLTRDNHHYIFDFTSWRKIKKLKIDFGSLEGDYYVELRLFDEVLFRGETSKEIKSQDFPSPSQYHFKNTNLYRISLYLEKRSDISTVENPYSFSIFPSY